MNDEIHIGSIPVVHFTSADWDVLGVLWDYGLILTKRMTLEEFRAEYPSPETMS